MIYADGMHGRFRLGYGAQFIHVAAALAEERSEIDDLVACDADPNARDAGGCTPLHYAAWNNPVAEAVKALFKAGTDPEACDGHGRKPLDHAISAANDAFIKAAPCRGRRSCRQRRCRRERPRYGALCLPGFRENPGLQAPDAGRVCRRVPRGS